jgi:hypothetical protein
MVETFVKQMMDDINNEEVVDLSLNCLTLIYKNDDKSATLIEKHYQKLLELCLARYKVPRKVRKGQSVGSFITHLKEERSHLVDFIVVLFEYNEKILGDLIEYLNKGDEATQ